MKLSIGIVGLPNVGKSTLFNALLKKQVANVANYPFCTIEPNVGVVAVPDERLPVLAKIVNTQTIIPAVVEFYDIAGLVKGASKGEGLGNAFLSHIREVAAIAHVVRLFDDGNIIHVANKIDPVDDVKTIESELMLADLSTLSKQQEPRMNATKEQKETYVLVKRVEDKLNDGIPVRKQGLTPEQQEMLRSLHLLTSKPLFYVVNVSENQLTNMGETEEKIKEFLRNLDEADANYLWVSAKLEEEVVALEEPEQKEYLAQYNLIETGLNRLIKLAYTTLGLISFLTAGEKEVRAWTIERGTSAPQAAGVIHTDFEKHFIRADVIPYAIFVDKGGWVKARDQGLVATVGRDYIMKEDDVVEFKIGS